MTEPVARLHIALTDTDTLIWRRVDVPIDASLKILHDVIQGAMGWLDYHLWEFEAVDKRYGVPDPDWEDHRLLAAKNAKLKVVLDHGIRQFLYTYDVGDNWDHIVTIEAVRDGEPGTKYPRYVEGERRAPPEDCGGTPGFETFLEAIAKRRAAAPPRRRQGLAGQEINLTRRSSSHAYWASTLHHEPPRSGWWFFSRLFDSSVPTPQRDPCALLAAFNPE